MSLGKQNFANEHKKTALRTGRLIGLAVTYSREAFRLTTIGATAFHFRVRNGAGWGHCAIATRIPPPGFPRSGLLMIILYFDNQDTDLKQLHTGNLKLRLKKIETSQTDD